MYCAVEEAFDNPLRQQMQKVSREHNIKNHRESLTRNIEDYQKNNGLRPPHTSTNPAIVEQYINDRVHPSPDMPFFTAQGGYNANAMSHVEFDEDSDKGTTISELKRQEEDSFFDDSSSFLDSNYLDLVANNKPKVKLGHNHYINKFLKSIADDGSDAASIASSQDDQVYDHIKSCKYCRNQINKKMKKMYEIKIENFNNSNISAKETSSNVKLDVPEEIFGYKFKEIIIIIAVSIMIIFILDLLVRVGRKINR